MTDQEINISIAEACGYKFDEVAHQRNAAGNYSTDFWEWRHPDGYECERVPDFANDLNAMHEAEEAIRNNQFHSVNYPHEVFKVTTGMEWKWDMGYFFPTVIRATAKQRAEAFLKTIGKWKRNP